MIADSSPRTPKSETLSLQELAELFGLGTSIAYELAAKNALPIPVFKIGRKYYAFREHYDAFKADQLALRSVTAL